MQQPGQPSINPAGKPKGPHLTTILRRLIQQEIDVTDPISKTQGKKPIGEALNLKLLANALKGDQKALRMVFEYIDGKPEQPITLPGGKEHLELLRDIIKKAAKVGKSNDSNAAK